MLLNWTSTNETPQFDCKQIVISSLDSHKLSIPPIQLHTRNHTLIISSYHTKKNIHFSPQLNQKSILRQCARRKNQIPILPKRPNNRDSNINNEKSRKKNFQNFSAIKHFPSSSSATAPRRLLHSFTWPARVHSQPPPWVIAEVTAANNTLYHAPTMGGSSTQRTTNFLACYAAPQHQNYHHINAQLAVQESLLETSARCTGEPRTCGPLCSKQLETTATNFTFTSTAH